MSRLNKSLHRHRDNKLKCVIAEVCSKVCCDLHPIMMAAAVVMMVPWGVSRLSQFEESLR